MQFTVLRKLLKKPAPFNGKTIACKSISELSDAECFSVRQMAPLFFRADIDEYCFRRFSDEDRRGGVACSDIPFGGRRGGGGGRRTHDPR